MRHDRGYWSRQVEGWRSSGLSVKAYSERHGLVYGTMSYWTRRLRSPESEGREQQLVELKARARESTSEVGQPPAIELLVAGRYLLRLWPGTRTEQLREVIEVLEER